MRIHTQSRIGDFKRISCSSTSSVSFISNKVLQRFHSPRQTSTQRYSRIIKQQQHVLSRFQYQQIRPSVPTPFHIVLCECSQLMFTPHNPPPPHTWNTKTRHLNSHQTSDLHHCVKLTWQSEITHNRVILTIQPHHSIRNLFDRSDTHTLLKWSTL